MSEQEGLFLKRLQKFLIAAVVIAVPLTLTSAGNLIVSPFKIKANRELAKSNQAAIISIKDSYTTRADVLMWMNQNQRSIDLFQKALDTQDQQFHDEALAIRKEMDNMMRDILTLKARGKTTQ